MRDCKEQLGGIMNKAARDLVKIAKSLIAIEEPIEFAYGEISADCPECGKPFSQSVCKEAVRDKTVRCRCGLVFQIVIPQHPIAN